MSIKEEFFMKKLLTFISATLLLFSIGCNSDTSDTSNTQMTTHTVVDTQVSAPAEANTSAKVDEIARQAKADAQSIDETKTNEAISYIRNNYPNYFDNNETMETAMYYGYLLEYAYADTNELYMQLGMDTYQSIKYVYRGVEKVEDNATQENLAQIKESLDGIN